MKFCNIGCCVNNELVNGGNEFTLDRYIERLDAYREAGISHLELSHLMALTADDAVKLRNECTKRGLVIWSVHSENYNDEGGMSPGGAYGSSTVEGFFADELHCAEVAQSAGVRAFVVHLPNYTKQPRYDFDRNCRFMERLADITHKHDLTLAIENCTKGDLEHIIKIVDKLDRPDVGVNLDAGHYFRYENNDVAGAVRKIGHRLKTLHLHDNFGLNDDHQAPGIGLIDWESTIGAILETPYEGPLMMELTCPSVKSHRTAELLRTFAYEKELVLGAACLRFYFSRAQKKI